MGALKAVLALVHLAVSSSSLAQELALPFEGRWFVLQSGDTPNMNHHMRFPPKLTEWISLKSEGTRSGNWLTVRRGRWKISSLGASQYCRPLTE